MLQIQGILLQCLKFNKPICFYITFKIKHIMLEVDLSGHLTGYPVNSFGRFQDLREYIYHRIRIITQIS